MSNYKEELNNIHAPEDLILRTLNKVHEEEKKVEEEKAAKSSYVDLGDNSEYTKNDSNVIRIKSKKIITTVSTIAAAAAVLVLAIGASGMFKRYGDETASSSDMMMETTEASAESDAVSNSSSAASDSASEAAGAADDADTSMNYSYGQNKNKREGGVADSTLSMEDTEAPFEENNYASASLENEWEIPANVVVTSELKNIFNAGIDGLTGVTYEPAIYLGSRVKSGTELAFLCKATEDTGTSFWSVVYIKEELNGKASLMDAPSIILSESSEQDTVQMGEASGSALVGSWSIDKEDFTAEDGKVSEDTQNAIDEALNSVSFVTYEPVTILGSQVASGTNYAVLCKNVTSSKWAIVYVYKNLDGKGTINNVATFEFEISE